MLFGVLFRSWDKISLSIAAIADRLSLSPKTVRNQVSTIFGKLQVTDRAEAIIKAREAGLT